MFTTAELRTVVVGGQPLRVAVRPGRSVPSHGEPGQPARPALLLINGIGASLELLEPFTVLVDPAVEVIRFDPPGVGGSAQAPGPYRFTGISWGGAVAQHFATFQRTRCRRLVLVATAIAAVMHGGDGSNRVGAPRGYVYQLAAGAAWTSVPFLRWLRQPTLILSGDDDPIIPLANARWSTISSPKENGHG